jgi:hypothetical protein
MSQHCDDVIAGVPDHSVPGRLPVHSPSHHVVRAEGTSASFGGFRTRARSHGPVY